MVCLYGYELLEYNKNRDMCFYIICYIISDYINRFVIRVN